MGWPLSNIKLYQMEGWRKCWFVCPLFSELGGHASGNHWTASNNWKQVGDSTKATLTQPSLYNMLRQRQYHLVSQHLPELLTKRCFHSRTSCLPWKTDSGPWFRLSCLCLWMFYTDQNCFSLRTRMPGGNVKVVVSFASKQPPSRVVSSQKTLMARPNPCSGRTVRWPVLTLWVRVRYKSLVLTIPK